MEIQENLARPVTVGIISARIGSEEVHAKVLIDLGGKPVIQHVYERVVAANVFDEVLIAADHDRIIDAAQEFGARTYPRVSIDTQAEIDRAHELIVEERDAVGDSP